eukprot:1701228-Prymnesium_polylepis.1
MYATHNAESESPGADGKSDATSGLEKPVLAELSVPSELSASISANSVGDALFSPLFSPLQMSQALRSCRRRGRKSLMAGFAAGVVLAEYSHRSHRSTVSSRYSADTRSLSMDDIVKVRAMSEPGDLPVDIRRQLGSEEFMTLRSSELMSLRASEPERLKSTVR